MSLKTSGRETIPIDVLIVPTIAAPLSNMPPEVTKLKYLKGLKLAHPVTQDGEFDISLVIGADHYWRIVQNHVVRGNRPTAVKSKIGYLLSGPTPGDSKQTQNTMLNVLTSSPDAADLEQFWKLESLGILHDEKDSTNAEELATHQKNSITRSEGKYSVQLPWELDHPYLPTNFDITLRRTQSTIRRLSREPELLKTYSSIIAEQEMRGFIEDVKDTDLESDRVHYIPHHLVKKDSSTIPIRIAYDCSCRQSADAPCLNDCLESAPLEVTDISDILIRFRNGRYAVSSDIEKAFLHIQLGRLPMVKQLRLFLDSDGCIRCGGRIHNAPVAELAKFPYLLPGKHHLTRLIIQDTHERLLHAGISATVTQMRQKYWIVSIRQNTKIVLAKCVTCRKVIGKPYTIPDPPPLPMYRLHDSDPFTNTGVDFTGALYVRDHAGNETKAYICLFTCDFTRAIHLELVPDLSEYSFMLAFRRFRS